MSEKAEVELLKAPALMPASTTITSFQSPLVAYLDDLSLPIDGVVRPIDDIRSVVDSLKDALSVLPLEERQRSLYLTKFAIAASVGLFDGALNYLWNETIRSLRGHVLKFDLYYFFSVVSKVQGRYKSLNPEEDLSEIGDADLLEASRRIGIISDIVYKQLHLINYMRNHASAAHPNDQEIDPYSLLGWLRTCLRSVITVTPEPSVVVVKSLLDSVREKEIPKVDIPFLGEEVARLNNEQIDDLLLTFFGMYVDSRRTALAKENILQLAPYVWHASSEDRRHEIGARFGGFRRSGELDKRAAAQEFIASVQGEGYKDEDSLAAELLDKLEALKRAHNSPGNFYNEYPHAKALGESLPTSGSVPRSARPSWVKVITLCYIGNGMGYREGVDESAEPYYKEYIEKFSEAEIIEFVKLLSDADLTSVLLMSKADRRLRMTSRLLIDKASNVHLKRILQMIIDAPDHRTDGVSKTTAYRQAITALPSM